MEFNRDGQMFGKERFRELIRENARLTAHEIIDAVYHDLNNYALGLTPADDITLVIIKLENLLETSEDWQI
jgi:sigma-B regulation protein RsbU (phosphoserine phosphatase)